MRLGDRSGWRAIKIPNPFPPRGTVIVTISEWQEPDGLHRACYDQGGMVIELDEDENLVRAYQKPVPPKA